MRARDPEPADEARRAAGAAAQNRCSLPTLPNPSDEMICWPLSAPAGNMSNNDAA